MYCPKCNAELTEGSVICNVCGEHFEMESQRGKFLMAKARTLSLLSDVFHSTRFLVFSIFVSILCGVSFLCTVSSFSLDAALTLAFSIVATIACWQLYASKDAPDAKKVKKLRWLHKVWHVFSNIIYITFIVVLALCIISLAFLGALWNTIEEEYSDTDIMWEVANALYEEDLISYEDALEIASYDVDSTILFAIMVGITVVFALFIAFFIIYSIMLKRSEKYITALEDTCRTGEYNATKCPGKFMIVMGVLYALFYGGTSFTASFGDIEISSGAAGLLPLAIGAYLVCAGLLFNTIHTAELENNKSIVAEEATLAHVAHLTNEAVRAAAYTAPAEKVVEETPIVEEAPAVEEAPVVEDAPSEENNSTEG